MPDWSYRTLFRPLLHRMSAQTARKLTLCAMGTVSRTPAGTLLIRTLGHIEPSPLLESKIGDVRLTAPVGLSGEVDPEGLAQNALAQLGFGFLEIGPVTMQKTLVNPTIQMDHHRETIDYPHGPETIGPAEAARQLVRRRHDRAVFARISPSVGVTSQAAADQLRMLGIPGLGQVS